MSDLERARAHLLNRQADLVEARIWKNSHSPRLGMAGYENNFFAALSWVWEEQEKDPATCAARLIEMGKRFRERVATVRARDAEGCG